jgi:putative sigma-54 modulation protein
MRIEYTGRRGEVPREIRALAERKLTKLGKVLHGITDVHVVLASDKHRQQVEVSLHSPHVTLTAAEEGTDAGRSLATVLDRLARQAQRRVGRLRERKRRGSAEDRVAAVAPRKVAAPRVVRSRPALAKPMTVEDAALQVTANDDAPVVFRDAVTARLGVLYRRKDGSLGLIEPEA